MSRLTSTMYVWKTSMFVFLHHCATCKHGMHNCTPHPSLFGWRLGEAGLWWLQGFPRLNCDVDETNTAWKHDAATSKTGKPCIYSDETTKQYTLRSKKNLNTYNRHLSHNRPLSNTHQYLKLKNEKKTQLMIPFIMWGKMTDAHLLHYSQSDWS